MTNVTFEPQAIELHLAAYYVAGAARNRVFVPTAPPTLRGTLHTVQGSQGYVEVALNEAEQTALDVIVHAACDRAERLALASLAATG